MLVLHNSILYERLEAAQAHPQPLASQADLLPPEEPEQEDLNELNGNEPVRRRSSAAGKNGRAQHNGSGGDGDGMDVDEPAATATATGKSAKASDLHATKGHSGSPKALSHHGSGGSGMKVTLRRAGPAAGSTGAAAANAAESSDRASVP